ncbi:MAG: S41 family peptidase [Bdellovibrio sp.]|jgi:carboxyl-terminal processing protease
MKAFLFLFTSLSLSPAAFAQLAGGQAVLECKYLYTIEQAFLSQHVKINGEDAALQARLVEQYVKRLDPTKVYLLQTDVDEVKKMMVNVLAQVKNKDCAVLNKVQALLLTRVKERAAFAKKMLGKTYSFDAKVEFVFDPENKKFAQNNQEAEDFLSKYIHFQVSNYLASDMKIEEAKANVIKSWDRTIKRVTDMKNEDLLAGYLDSFARAMDPHSAFMARDNNEDFRISMSLSLKGIGATLSSQDGFTVIEALVPGGPAARSGLLDPQDKIISVGQGEKGAMENVIEMDLRDVVRKIRGEKGTKVRLTVLRKKGEGKKRFEITLVRDQIKLEDEAASILYQDKDVGGVKKKIGVINFPSFYSDGRRGGRSSAADVKKIIAEARAAKVDGIVLDLSTNGGGSLEDAVKIAGLFFATGNVVKQATREDEKGDSTTLRDSDPTVDWSGPLVVLTSRISASASEIVAGTLKDYKRAVVVGSDHTFGKGTVQTVIDIPPQTGELGAMKVTVGTFFIPGGNSTQHRGVLADVTIPSQYDSDEVGEKSLDYSLPPAALSAFLSPDAYVKAGNNAWKVLQPDWIKKLADQSKVRVDKSDDFKKVVDELKKAKATGKLIKLADVMKDKEKKEKEKTAKNKGKAEKDKEYLKRADVQESVNVLLDLIQLQGSSTVATK